MHKYNFNQKTIDVTGKELDDSLAHNLSLALGGINKLPALKAYGWYEQLRKDGCLLVDKADVQELKKFIESHEGLFVVLKGQLLNVFDNAITEK